MDKIKELENKIAEISKELEELKCKKTSDWTPEHDEDYWFINSNANIENDVWVEDYVHYFRRDYVKIFKTKEETQEYLKYIKTKKEYSYEFTLSEWEDKKIKKYYIAYDFEDKCLGVSMNLMVKRVGKIYFKFKNAKEFIDKYKKQILKYEFGIEEE